MELLKSSKRLSFKIGGKDAWETNYRTEMTKESDTLTTVYHFENGLKVTNIAKKHATYPAYEWVNYFENTAAAPSELISELWDCDWTLPIAHEDDPCWTAYLPDKRTATKVYAPTGSTWDALEFYCNVDQCSGNGFPNHIRPGETKCYATSGGRSSEAHAPFFHVHKEGEGYLFAIGWSGQWNCTISRGNDTVTFRSKIEDTHFRMQPGETFRTSSVIMIPYHGDLIDGQNIWRRFVKEQLSPLGKDVRPSEAPLDLTLWGGITSDRILKRLELIDQHDIPFDCIWMDAGWYGKETAPSWDEFEGDWASHTGDWTVSPQIHPNGLRDVAKVIHRSGRKFLLWFEPERVVRTTPIVSEHPEYFLTLDGPEGWSLLLNLGDQAAWQYCYDMLAAKIEELELDWLRIDFNFAPLPYWRKADTDETQGLSEIRYINGLYRLWDALLSRFPHLMIDNCASGGRRIDAETIRRSVPLWRSDYQCPANYNNTAVQCHTQTFNAWLPYSGTAAWRCLDAYNMRSSYASGFGIRLMYSEKDSLEEAAGQLEQLKPYILEAKKVRPYLSADFYPLTEVSDHTDVWCANQFHRPGEGDGVLQVFRREDAPYETARFYLRGLKPEADYTFTDADGGNFSLRGRVLMENGLSLNLPKKRTAKLYFYQETENK